MSKNWLRQSACDLGRGIESGDIDPVTLTATFLDAARSHQFSDRIYARLTEDRALAEARSAQQRAANGLRLGLLDGVPISWKDLFDTAGTATEAGSALLADRIPSTDAEVLRNATQSGLVCLGKTHMSELAFSGLGLNPITATPPCVNDHDAVSGGSSSGAAASVAFHMAAAGIGSDTGGSVRIPSAWNDLVGLKTTLGRLPVKGTVPLCASFDTVGPLCRSVEDATHLLAAMSGSKAADLKGASLEGRKLLILEKATLDEVRTEPLAAFHSSVEKLQAAGAIVERGTIEVVDSALDLSPVLFAAEAYGQWKSEIEAAPEKMYPEILDRFRGGRDVLATEYLQAWRLLAEYRAIWAQETAEYDAVIMPTCPILPPDKDRLLSESAYYVSENLLTLRNTRIGNLMGLAGLTIPTGIPSCGLMFLSSPFSEDRLLRLGCAAEAALR